MVAKSNSFGAYLLKKRIAAGLSLREVGLRLRVSHVYVGEVERGVRGPFQRERWKDLMAAIPGVTLEDLERNADLAKGIQLQLEDAPPAYQDLGLILARRIQERDLSEPTLNEVLRILKGDKGE